jgi:hypothetical protein
MRQGEEDFRGTQASIFRAAGSGSGYGYAGRAGDNFQIYDYVLSVNNY